MDFRKATDALFEPVGHADLARALGVSVPLIRQARLKPDANAHRAAPEGWEQAVSRLAEERAKHYHRLAEKLRNEHGETK
jgi:hypothetical protein